MKMPLRLKRWLEVGREADAFLLRAAGFTPLVHAIQMLPRAQVLPVAGGFLLLPSGPTSAEVHGAIRLRRLGGELYVLHDALLLPSLLPDEIAGLTRERGLIVLSDQNVLEFDPRSPLLVSRWLTCNVDRSAWEPLPPAPALADELRTIERPTPPAAVIEILASGEPDGADPIPTDGPRESDRPAGAGSTLKSAAASIRMAAGGLFTWLGRNLGMPNLAKAGANLARKAIESVPRLSEKLFGEQEAALRDVLRELQEGDPEKALRRAPPAFGDPDAHARIATDSSLGLRDPRWSLGALIGGGVQAGWLGGGDIWAKLAEEYRRLAREAAARGDFRRAAYLHGVLLRDFRAAANALLAGGLYRDAAILLRDKVKDESAAAAAFEQAGDFDEALRLYDRGGHHLDAGDLLMRLDDRERARERFILAADAHTRCGHWHAAGELIWHRTADRGTACMYFQCGWNHDNADSLACGRRLFAEHTEAEDWPRAAQLFDEAESRFTPPRSSDAREFFHSILKSTRLKLPVELQDELTDRIRLLFARHLRPAKEQGRGENLARDLFPVDAGWTPAVGRDAAFASGAPRKKSAEIPVAPPVAVVTGTVRAVAFARKQRCALIATDDALTIWSEARGRVRICGLEGKSILGLACDPYVKHAFLLASEQGTVRLSSFFHDRAETWVHASQFQFGEPADQSWHLEPRVVLHDSDYRVNVATPERREMFQSTLLLSQVPVGYQVNGSNTHLLAATTEHFWDWDDRFIRCLDGSGNVLLRWVPHWTPAIPAGSSLAVPPLDWLSTESGSIEIAGVDAEGIVHYSRFSLKEGGTCSFDTDGERWRFRAACLVSSGSVIGATDDNRLIWIRPRMIVELRIADDVLRSSPSRIAALHKSGLSREFTVVFEDGRIAVVRDWS